MSWAIGATPANHVSKDCSSVRKAKDCSRMSMEPRSFKPGWSMATRNFADTRTKEVARIRHWA
eukprot:10903934-Alexandrium_andersonii.AAC.1